MQVGDEIAVAPGRAVDRFIVKNGHQAADHILVHGLEQGLGAVVMRVKGGAVDAGCFADVAHGDIVHRAAAEQVEKSAFDLAFGLLKAEIVFDVHGRYLPSYVVTSIIRRRGHNVNTCLKKDLRFRLRVGLLFAELADQHGAHADITVSALDEHALPQHALKGHARFFHDAA